MADTLFFVGCPGKITMDMGSIVEIKLEAIQGTGYQWLIMEESPIVKILDQDILKYAETDDQEKMPGMKSQQILQFKAIKKGNSQIQLVYKRTFEKEVEKSCTIEFEIK